jgi:hypothetical protein
MTKMENKVNLSAYKKVFLHGVGTGGAYRTV